ncbi:MAG: hypothetical protein WCW13_01315 [archaeon]|jgi:hypothetical protein
MTSRKVKLIISEGINPRSGKNFPARNVNGKKEYPTIQFKRNLAAHQINGMRAKIRAKKDLWQKTISLIRLSKAVASEKQERELMRKLAENIFAAHNNRSLLDKKIKRIRKRFS